MKISLGNWTPYVISSVLFASTAFATPAEQKNGVETQPADKEELNHLSEAFGHFIGKNLESSGISFNVDLLIKGIRDGVAGKPAPMTEDTYFQTLTKYQEKAQGQQAEKNLKEANDFLAKNARNSTVIEIEKGKLQYQVLKPGQGALVEQDAVPQILFTGKLLDGTVFGSTDSNKEPLPIPLAQTIPGLQKGLAGMHEGEKRRLFIHPDLGYGTTGPLPPNSLLTFDVEVIKANSPDDTSLESVEDDDDFVEEDEAMDEDNVTW